ncbi:response regulator [Pilimelia columellifera]|uniref:Response regulator n=1 Tax=Pilimelia columellifera subsp. columellifera TaxID=706583 RepID=A0ABP6ASH1_9ACTN
MPNSAALQVLVIEDDLSDLALIEGAFESCEQPSQLHHVADGVEAMEYLHGKGAHEDAARPDLMLLDLNMPRMDGREVLARVKSDELLRTIPIVVFTTSAEDRDVTGAYQAHANAYVTKPIDLVAFESSIAEIRSFFGDTISRSDLTLL